MIFQVFLYSYLWKNLWIKKQTLYRDMKCDYAHQQLDSNIPSEGWPCTSTFEQTAKDLLIKPGYNVSRTTFDWGKYQLLKCKRKLCTKAKRKGGCLMNHIRSSLSAITPNDVDLCIDRTQQFFVSFSKVKVIRIHMELWKWLNLGVGKWLLYWVIMPRTCCFSPDWYHGLQWSQQS
jgi:hypothetical protein